MNFLLQCYGQRRKTAIDDIAVKPITQFPVSLAEEATEEQFSASYPNVRTVAIKKGNQSLGIMIIEGKHAEVGQGIFISDIQEGSFAEKAGLEIGEMILAVNKDSLVGSNYDTAANLLKRTEGLVTLVVSNPGKRDQQQGQPAAVTQSAANVVENSKQNAVGKPATLKPSGPPSRPSTPVPEPVADLTTCSITSGKDVAIEIPTDNKGLGVFFVGGKDTAIPNGIVVVEVYPGGAADRDNRLRPGDQILEVNATQLKDVTHTTASQALRQTLPKVSIAPGVPAGLIKGWRLDEVGRVPTRENRIHQTGRGPDQEAWEGDGVERDRQEIRKGGVHSRYYKWWDRRRGREDNERGPLSVCERAKCGKFVR
jgi:inactivation no afterpotential D protein